ncbi:MAG: transporter substrate-binding domain-containing protein [Desulfobacteraceae bacterium]|nr:transporter substrate-binding domain-containing protein [Desulfobacteraceae bacterium]
MNRFSGLLAFYLIFFAALYFPCQHVFAFDSPAGQDSSIVGREPAAQGINLTPEEKAFLENHPVIRVGNEEDWPPFDFSEHGRPKGYAIEHLELLGRRLGISFEYVNGYTWFELLGLFREGKIDLLPCLWKTGSREGYMHFTEPYLELPYVIVVLKENRSIRTVEDLKGRTVAAARGYKQEEVLRAYYPEIDIYQVQNALQGLEAVVYGEADAYIGYLGTVAYLMTTRFMGSLRICGESKAPGLGPQGLHIAVRREISLMGDILQKAMNTVSDREKVELAEKWIPVEQTGVPDLTTEEKVFLRKHPVLKVDNLRNWPPFNFVEKGEPRGFCIDYIELLAAKLDLELEFITGSHWGEFMEGLQTGEVDCLIDVVETPDRQGAIAFTDPYLTIFSGIVVRKGQLQYTRLDDLAGRKVAVPEAFYYQELLKRHYPEVELVAEKDTLSCLKAVSSGMVDAALSEKPVSDYLINKHFLTDLKSVPLMGSSHFVDTPVSMGVRKDRKILRDILQKAMDSVSQEEKAGLYRRWLDKRSAEPGKPKIALTPKERQWLEEKKALRICVHPDRPPFEEIDSEGAYSGIVADIMSLLTERTGVPIRVLPTESWRESLEAMEEGRCDLLSAVSQNNTKETGFAVSKPYIESVNVIVAGNAQPYIPDLHSLEGKMVAIEKGNPIGGYLEENFPQISLGFYSGLNRCLLSVAEGKADAAVGSLHRVSYAIHELGLYDLKIAGQTPYKEYLRLGVSRDNPILTSIMNKALESLSEREVSRITGKWLSIRYDKGVDTVLLMQILGAGALLIALFVFWNRKLARLNKQLGTAHEALAVKSLELERLSVTDKLTGIFNRMKLEDLLQSEIRRTQRNGRPFSVIMMDVDNFKDVNDSYGHQVGDEVLREIAGLLKANVRKADSLGRWGGEEFLIICPDTTGKGAAILAENLRRLIDEHELTVAGGVSCSFGVAEHQPQEGLDPLLGRVDRAMYRAKRRGRNRVELDEPQA